MTRICWWLVDALAGSLQPDEGEAVLGDLAESGPTGREALRDLLGLVFRRQAALWKEWRPWLALLGLAVPLSMLLGVASNLTAGFSSIYLWMYASNWDWSLLQNAAFRHDFPEYVGMVILAFLRLACWSWTVGLVLGSLTRPTAWVSGALFCLMLCLGTVLGVESYLLHLLFRRGPGMIENPNSVVFAVAFYRRVLPIIVLAFLVLLPSLRGIRQGLRLVSLRPLLRTILGTCAIATFAATAIQMGLWWSFPNMMSPARNGLPATFLSLVAYWPILYWIARATGKFEEKNT